MGSPRLNAGNQPHREYRPWLVEPRRLFDAMNSVDSSSDKKRGLLLIE